MTQADRIYQHFVGLQKSDNLDEKLSCIAEFYKRISWGTSRLVDVAVDQLVFEQDAGQSTLRYDRLGNGFWLNGSKVADSEAAERLGVTVSYLAGMFDLLGHVSMIQRRLKEALDEAEQTKVRLKEKERRLAESDIVKRQVAEAKKGLKRDLDLAKERARQEVGADVSRLRAALASQVAGSPIPLPDAIAEIPYLKPLGNNILD